jgi:hypothetical protein
VGHLGRRPGLRVDDPEEPEHPGAQGPGELAADDLAESLAELVIRWSWSSSAGRQHGVADARLAGQHRAVGLATPGGSDARGLAFGARQAIGPAQLLGARTR